MEKMMTLAKEAGIKFVKGEVSSIDGAPMVFCHSVRDSYLVIS